MQPEADAVISITVSYSKPKYLRTLGKVCLFTIIFLWLWFWLEFQTEENKMFGIEYCQRIVNFREKKTQCLALSTVRESWISERRKHSVWHWVLSEKREFQREENTVFGMEYCQRNVNFREKKTQCLALSTVRETWISERRKHSVWHWVLSEKHWQDVVSSEHVSAGYRTQFQQAADR